MIALYWALVVLVLLLFYYEKRAHSYWERKKIQQLKPCWFFGNVKELLFRKCTSEDFGKRLYMEMKNKGLKLLGIYSFYDPILVVRDVDLIKHILIKDFNYFSHRGSFCNETVERHAGHVANVTGERWRNLRKTLTPAFTPGKMKHVFGTVLSCTSGLVEVLDKSASTGQPVEMKDTFARFTTDVIGSTVFGIECNTLKHSDPEFRKYGAKMFERTFWNGVMRVIVPKLPTCIVTALGLRLSNKDAVDFFWNLTHANIEKRKKHNIVRTDFLQILLQMTKQGEPESIFTEKDVISQILLFYGAGFEPASSVATFTLFEMALNQDIQDKLRSEINKAIEKYDDKITYETIQEIGYLECVIYESMRKHSTTTILNRKCDQNYTIPGTNIVIEKDTLVWLPVSGYYMDPEYFPNPEIYDPDRFNEETKAKRPGMVFLPFGEGPRQCIGLRFGMLQTKLGLTTILRNFKVTLNDRTSTHLKHDNVRFFPSPNGGVWLNFERI